MTEYTFMDIFATKGPEYLVVIFFLAIFIPFWKLVNSTPVRRRVPAMVSDAARFFDRTHTWSFLDSGGEVQIGVDSFLGRLLSSARITALPGKGMHVKRGEPLFKIAGKQEALQVPAPISGTISRVRTAATNDESGRSWLVRLSPDNWEQDQDRLMAGKNAVDWIRGEFNRLRDFMAYAAEKHDLEPALVTLQDGGEIQPDLFADLPVEYWKEFQAEFIDAVLEL